MPRRKTVSGRQATDQAYSIKPQQRRAVTLIELLVVIVILGILATLALPSRSNMGRTQLLAALRIIQADVGTMQSLARSAPAGDIYAMIMHHPDAPLVQADFVAPPVAYVFAPPSGACCLGEICTDSLTKTDCQDTGGWYVKNNTLCTDVVSQCIDATVQPVLAPEVQAALDTIPEIVVAGTTDWPNNSPPTLVAWPGTSGGPGFEAVGSADGDQRSFYRCGIIRNADTASETFVELSRPDGRPWTFDFAERGLDLVRIGNDTAPGFYSSERALRFDHLGKPSRNVLFSLEAEDLIMAVSITTAGEVLWTLGPAAGS